MSLAVRFSAEAVSELEAVAAWYVERQPGLAAPSSTQSTMALMRVAEWPCAGAPVPALSQDLDVRRVPVARFPYNLPYVVLDDHVRVLAVAHDRRRPGYWQPRVDG